MHHRRKGKSSSSSITDRKTIVVVEEPSSSLSSSQTKEDDNFPSSLSSPSSSSIANTSTTTTTMMNSSSQHNEDEQQENVEEEKNGPLPEFAFQEIRMGRLIGQGGFSSVNEINNIVINELYDTGDVESKCRLNFVNTITNEEQYVIKQLRTDLPEDEYQKGIVDLAIECNFLKDIKHNSIISMRAMANSNPLENKFFIILDRLQTTLDKKMNYWRKVVGESIGIWLGPLCGYCCSKKNILQKLWLSRLIVCRDIASAIKYLHSHSIVYRDLKPDNVGFDFVNDDVKLFDFGLAKKLDDSDKHEYDPDVYHLTGNTGSLRYMAPEVASCLPYNNKVDVYSFGILFWQICSLTTPYAGYSMKMHADRVVKGGVRPKPDISWPNIWRELMEECWSSDYKNRPSFDYILQTLDTEVYELMVDIQGTNEEQQGTATTATVDNKDASNIHAKHRKYKHFTEQQKQLDIDTRKQKQQQKDKVGNNDFTSGEPTRPVLPNSNNNNNNDNENNIV